MKKVLGACPLDCPDGCSWVVTVRTTARPSACAATPSTPTPAARCATRSTATSSTPRRPTACCTRCAASAARARGGSSGSPGTRRSTRSPSALRERTREYGGEAIWPFHGHRHAGLHPGAGRRRAPVLERARRLAPRHDHLHDRGRRGLATPSAQPVGMDPEDVAHAKLDPAVGHEPAHEHHHLWRSSRTRAGTARTSWPSTRSAPAPPPRPTSTSPRCPAPTPRSRSACCTWSSARAREDREFIDGAHARLGRLPRAHPGVPAGARGRDHRAAEASDRGARRAAGARRGRPRSASTHGHAAPRRRRDGGADDHVHPRRDRRLALAGRRRCYATSGLLPRQLGRALARRPAPQPGAHAVDDPPRRGPARASTTRRSRRCSSTAATRWPATRTSARSAAAWRARTCSRWWWSTSAPTRSTTPTSSCPATMQTEHLDLHRRLRPPVPVLERAGRRRRPGECLPTTEMFRRLARRMGLTEPSLYDSDEDLARQLLDSRRTRRSTASRWRRCRKQGLGAAERRPARSFPSPRGSRPPPAGWSSYSPARAGAGHDPLPGFTPHGRPRVTGLILISPASHYFLNTTFAQQPASCAARTGRPGDHPASGRRGGPRHRRRGRGARRQRARGRSCAVAEVTDRGAARAWRPRPRGAGAKFNGGATVNATIDERDADMGGGAVFHDNRVEVALV